MDKEYAFLKEYTDLLIKKGLYSSDIGLWNGKIGIAIYLLHFAKITQNNKYENLASKLTDSVYKQISHELPFCFGNGLLGIGCGFEYIIQNGFVDANRDEILSEIDFVAINIIDYRSIDNLSFGKGVCGIGFYLYNRLKNRTNDNNSIIVLKLTEYLIYLIDWVEDLIQETTEKQDYNDAYFLLNRLLKLNVFNYKVEKLLTLCMHKIINFNCQITDNYELLGISSLKVLKPWI